MKNIAIIDDSEFDINNLSALLRKFFVDKKITINIDLYHNPKTFLERFDSQFNLIFIDIEMPELDGINLAKMIRDKDKEARLIFISSHPKYAIDGYGLNVLSFLVKPITSDSLNLKMNSILPMINEDEDNKLSFRYRDEIKVFYIKDIVRVQVFGHYIKITLNNGETLEHRGSLNDIEKSINSKMFVRCNHSDLLNIKYIKEIKDNFVITTNGEKLDISRNKKKSFMTAVLDYFGKK